MPVQAYINKTTVLTQDEYDRLVRAADGKGLSQSRYLKTALLEKLERDEKNGKK